MLPVWRRGPRGGGGAAVTTGCRGCGEAAFTGKGRRNSNGRVTVADLVAELAITTGQKGFSGIPEFRSWAFRGAVGPGTEFSNVSARFDAPSRPTQALATRS